MARQTCGLGSVLGLAVAIGAVLAAAACGSSAAGAPGRADRPDARPEPVRGRTVRPAASSYANPGGMWLPSQMPGRVEQLQRLGIDIDPGLLSDPSSPLLQAVATLSGCSAAFVSSEGLLITSHHCVRSALQYHSTPDHNLVDRGFLARTRAQERWNGPAARAHVTQRVHDVTAAMIDGLDAIADDASRQAEIVARQKKLVAECEGGRSHQRCQVVRTFDGAAWLRIQSLEIRDLRLVYAPPAAIGWFGGAQDSWAWPRHSGDFAVYRAYVGPDGVPADHSARNVPYRSQHRLKIASKPLREGDLVVVAGYPGATGRLRTAAELDEAVSWHYPRLVAREEAVLAALRGLGDRDAAAAARPIVFEAEHRLARTRGMLDALSRAGAVDKRRRAEAALAAWIDQRADRAAAWGGVIGQLERLQADRRGARERDAAIAELSDARLFAAAATIVRMAEERGAPDAERDPRYQQRNWKQLEAALIDSDRRYQRDVDAALLGLALTRAAHDLLHNRGWLERVLDRRAMAAAASGDHEAAAREIDRMVRRLYGATRLEREEVRVELLHGATTAQLARSADPMIRMAVALRPVEKEIEEAAARLTGATALVRPRYVAAMRAFHGGDLAPDANGTLRIAYGTVRGFRPRADGPLLRPFTTLRELVARHRGSAPFELPDPLLAAAGRDAGPYRDHKLDDVPVDFLSDVDTATGNSGSPTLNARGELCGLVFDSTADSASGEWLYSPDSHRSVHVDIRYAAWIMDAVDGADDLLAEMGVTPSL